MNTCKMCGCSINSKEVLCKTCNRIEDEDILKMIEEREKRDTGIRYSFEEVKEILKRIKEQ